MRRVIITNIVKMFDSAMVLHWLVILTIIFLFHSTSVLARQVTLAWDANAEPVLGGYRLYYGPTSRNYESFVDVGNQTSYTLFGLEEDRPYYFAVTAYDINKTIESAFSNEVFLAPSTLLAAQESPSEGSYESGIGLIRGWVCDVSTVEVEIDGGERRLTGYGTRRGDTATVCGTANTGYGLTLNWNVLGTGLHTLRAFADGVEFSRVTFHVTTLGEDFLRGVGGEYTLPDFPHAGSSVTLRWSEAHQNFVIVGTSANRNSANQRNIAMARYPLNLLSAAQESPSEGSYESGIGLIRGWVCNASTVEVEIDGGERRLTAHGTQRGDTAEVCGTPNTGYGLTLNWNSLGDGLHTLRALADGVEFANVTFHVTTLGEDFLQGAPEREYTLPDFPRAGSSVTVRWSEAHQNFVIVGFESP